MAKKKSLSPFPEEADDEVINIRLRIPVGLHATLSIEAKEQGRSLNAQILSRLYQTLDPSFLAWDAEQRLRGTAEMKVLRDLRQDPKVQALVDQVVEEMRSKGKGKK
jgi:hypothetical protein